jgi:sterol 14-demethylase
MYIDGKLIPTGALVAYPVADVHLDPALYPDPWKFDPTRLQPKGNLTYLGWGGGVCVFLPNMGSLELTFYNVLFFLFFFLLGA